MKMYSLQWIELKSLYFVVWVACNSVHHPVQWMVMVSPPRCYYMYFTQSHVPAWYHFLHSYSCCYTCMYTRNTHVQWASRQVYSDVAGPAVHTHVIPDCDGHIRTYIRSLIQSLTLMRLAIKLIYVHLLWSSRMFGLALYIVAQYLW